MLNPKRSVLNSVTAHTILMTCFMFTTGNATEPAPGKISVKNGQKIAFLGDSITAAGRRPGGYCQLVLSALKDQGIEATPVFAGISGHKSDQKADHSLRARGRFFLRSPARCHYLEYSSTRSRRWARKLA